LKGVTVAGIALVLTKAAGRASAWRCAVSLMKTGVGAGTRRC